MPSPPTTRRNDVSRSAYSLFALGLVVACSESPKTEAPGGPSPSALSARSRGQRVETTVVEPRLFVERVDVSATVTTQQDATLSARASGTVTGVVDLGDSVKRGRVLARIDADLARAQLAQAQAGFEAAQASLDLARDTYERQKPLFEQDVISALEFENIESQLNQAKASLAQSKAAVAQAREQLEQSRVVAPFAGSVEEKFVEDGEQVTMGTPVVRLVDASTVKVRGGVPERYAPDIRKGRQATVRFNAYGLEPRTGPVTFVASVIDPASRTFTIEVELDNPSGQLKPEMVARILVERSETPDALVVPQTAVLHDNEGDSVFVVERDGDMATARRRRVRLGARAGGEVIVIDGLEAGDEVITVGQSSVASGDPVEVASGAS